MHYGFDIHRLMSNDNVAGVAKPKKDLELVFKSIVQFINENKFDDKVQTRSDIENETLKIYSKHTSAISRASAATSEILDLSYSSAEHHPFWMLLYNASEIVKSVLDAWDSEFSKDQISELYWRLEEIKSSLDRISKY